MLKQKYYRKFFCFMFLKVSFSYDDSDKNLGVQGNC